MRADRSEDMDVIFLLAKAKDTGGSFGTLRAREQGLFKEHRHDRGWTHSDPMDAESLRLAGKRWIRVGIVHFRHEEGEDEA
jgi:hypothetical protein